MKRILFFLLFFQSAIGAEEAIGTIIAIEGKARAKNTSAERPLSINSLIYLGETIIVEIESRLQIRFTDGALLNLLPETQYKIDAYQYRKLAKKDNYAAELIKGGFRSLSGSIAKKNPTEYKVKTPTSTLGLRGTVVEVRIVGDAVYFGVSSGVAIITNDAGSRLIGTGEKSQYAVVYSDHDIPEYLMDRPDYLDRKIFSEPIGGFSMERLQQIQTNRPNPNATAPSSGSSIQGLEDQQGGGGLKGGTQNLPGGASGSGGASVGGGC